MYCCFDNNISVLCWFVMSAMLRLLHCSLPSATMLDHSVTFWIFVVLIDPLELHSL